MIEYDDVWARLSMADAIAALDRVLSGADVPDSPQRTHLADRDQLFLTMPIMWRGSAGAKLVTIDTGNPARGLPLIHGAYVLFDGPGLPPRAVIEGRALTEIRTAAVSGVLTRHLARRGAARLAVFGAGAQGWAHVRAMAEVLDLADVRIVSRTPEAAARLAAFAREHVGVPASTARPDAVADADVICTCTSSDTPVFDGSLLPEGVHVNAIGAYRPDMREVDSTVVTSSRVVVETREAALAEAGDLLIPMGDGVWHPDEIVGDMREVVAGRVAGREREEDRTLFKSVGLAFEDLVIARAIVDGGGPGD